MKLTLLVDTVSKSVSRNTVNFLYIFILFFTVFSTYIFRFFDTDFRSVFTVN